MKYLIAGNWKMNTRKDEAVRLAWHVAQHAGRAPHVDVMIAPPYVWLSPVSDVIRDTPLQLGAQNVHWEEKGAFTGEIAAPMLKDLGCRYVIVGHSERRQYFGETNTRIHDKLVAVYQQAMIPILCVGETLDEREAGATLDVVGTQIREALTDVPVKGELVVAYEPVWAIGTGRAANPELAQEVHTYIRKVVKEIVPPEIKVRILYGGSVKPDNIAGFIAMPDIEGALVGGASLKADAFNAIVDAAEAASS